jgi:RNA polymerase sigma factor (sigma-70 family)
MRKRSSSLRLTPEQCDLVTSHMPLVMALAAKAKKGKPRNVFMADLIGAGVVGLCESATRFDPSRGVKFMTLAYPRVLGAIRDEIRQSYGNTSNKKGQARAEAHGMTVSYDLHPVLDDRPARATEQLILANEILARISPKERALAKALFTADRDVDVARQMGVSRSRVCHLKQELIAKMQRIAA